MPSCNQSPSKIQNGLINLPSSSTHRPEVHIEEWSRPRKIPSTFSTSSNTKYRVITLLHRHSASSGFSSLRSPHNGTSSCSGRVPHWAENAPPRKSASIISDQDLCCSVRHRESGRRTAFRSGDDQLLCAKQTSSLDSTDSSQVNAAIIKKDILLLGLQTFDGQSSNATTEVLYDPSEDEECVTSEANVLAHGPCFLADSGLNRRLRPNQRLQPWRIPYIQSPDRFISSRGIHSDPKDILVLGKAHTALTNRERLRRQKSESDDPFGSARHSSRYGASAQTTQTQQILRAGHLPSANVLSNRRDMLSNGNQRMIISNTWYGPTTHHSGTNPTGFGSNVPTYLSDFLHQSMPRPDPGIYENRLALAFDVDRTNRVLKIQSPAPASSTSGVGPQNCKLGSTCRKRVWKDNEWQTQGVSTRQICFKPPKQNVPMVPFRYVVLDVSFTSLTSCTVLEAPELRDDFYCSVLAYSPTIRRLAVALGSRFFLWSEETGAIYPPRELYTSPTRSSYITSLAFSSSHAGHAVLAIGRGDGCITMYSPVDKEKRFLKIVTSLAASHISFRPTPIRRPSQRHSAYIAENEVFLVGDETGSISVYFVEWPHDKERFLFDYHGGVVLHAKIAIHAQQICGLSWSPSGDYLATGGNDNICSLIQVSKILNSERKSLPTPIQTRIDEDGTIFISVALRQTTDVVIGLNDVRHIWTINAAVKAIAFCPWQRGLLAAGGGSNDRCIHFFHTISGGCLARIDCAAQVTSLIWSTSRRQIAATLGFAQPDHPFRIAVYSWPECQQVIAIPWHDEMRALYAIPYPVSQALGRRGNKGRSLGPRKNRGNCIVVAASDGSIKFHEIWYEDERAIGSSFGTLGGSDILEGMHGLDKESVDTIR